MFLKFTGAMDASLDQLLDIHLVLVYAHAVFQYIIVSIEHFYGFTDTFSIGFICQLGSLSMI